MPGAGPDEVSERIDPGPDPGGSRGRPRDQISPSSRARVTKAARLWTSHFS